MITQYKESLNWLHSLLQELEREGVTLPMGDYNYAFGLIEDVRDNLTDLTWGNTVAYSPSAIRTEIRESLWEGFSHDENDKAVLEWAEKATDNQLNEIAEYILQGNHIWDSYISDLIDGLRQGFEWAKSKEAK